MLQSLLLERNSAQNKQTNRVFQQTIVFVISTSFHICTLFARSDTKWSGPIDTLCKQAFVFGKLPTPKEETLLKGINRQIHGS